MQETFSLTFYVTGEKISLKQLTAFSAILCASLPTFSLFTVRFAQSLTHWNKFTRLTRFTNEDKDIHFCKTHYGFSLSLLFLLIGVHFQPELQGECQAGTCCIHLCVYIIALCL